MISTYLFNWILFLTGILLFALSNFVLFKPKLSNFFRILEAILAFIPMLGICTEIVFLIIRSISVVSPCDYSNDNYFLVYPNARDNKITRFLFNHLIWDESNCSNNENS